MKQLDGAKSETVMFSCNVNKINKFVNDSRTLMLTNLNIYNLDGKRIGRKVPIEKI